MKVSHWVFLGICTLNVTDGTVWLLYTVNMTDGTVQHLDTFLSCNKMYILYTQFMCFCFYIVGVLFYLVVKLGFILL